MKSKIKARKRFGQNFLVDQMVVDRIARNIDASPKDRVLEVGPGRGAITKALVDSGCQLTLVEIDRDLAENLRVAYPSATLMIQDVMQLDIPALATPLRVVGNLPYNISTPLLFKLFNHLDLIQDMHFMLQLEVVERMTAVPSTKRYGRLSIMTQLHCRAEKLFDVEPESFTPSPKVRSAIIRLTPNETRKDFDKSLLEQILISAFSARRKTIRNAMGAFLTQEDFVSLDLDPSLRPENLTLDDFVACTKLVAQKS
jgi:16S rRNA (adenine1518-N6/adenine1519-N6)-dimethyltransferase